MYVLNLYNIICQIYLNKTGEKERCLTSTAIKEIQTKPPYTHYNATIFNDEQYSQKDVGKPKLSYIASGEI